MLLNTKNHKEYTDKFVLSVLDLTLIENATEKDREYRLDEWARLYKAKTWEELKEIVARTPELDKVIADKDTKIADKDARIADMSATIEDLQKELAKYNAQAQ